MVAGPAFLATAIATWFALATARRAGRERPHAVAWTVALAMYAAASAALATGASTGWDAGTFRVFYLFGAVLNVAWLGLGTVWLLAPRRVARAATTGLLLFSGFAAGVLVATPLHEAIAGVAVPHGRDHLDALPRALAGIGSGLGALTVLAGALWSAVRYLRARGVPGIRRLAAANLLIAAGVLIASSGGLLQGLVGEDEGFALATAVAIAVIYSGFALASPPRSTRRSTLPAAVRGSSSTTTTRLGTL